MLSRIIAIAAFSAGLGATVAAQGADPTRLDPGQSFRDCPECPEMVVIPAGGFMMGAPAREAERTAWEAPQHRVSIRRNFALGRYEVSFAEWDACARDGGCPHWPNDMGWGRGDHPVINVGWDDARAFALWLRAKTGQDYRLPSEAEWEYSARAGTTTPFHYGDRIMPSEANYWATLRYGGPKGPFRARTASVGSFSANGFGLHDVHGNVWEWVADCWNQSYSSAPSDGAAWTSGDCERRVLRGGSWIDRPGLLRSANRYMFPARGRYFMIGFRVARTLSRTDRATE